MSKKRIALILVTAFLFFSASVFLFFRDGDDVDESSPEPGGRTYTNEEIGYVMGYPIDWEVREIAGSELFHPKIDDGKDLQTEIDLDTYSYIFGTDLVGQSPLTYIDGTINYNIEKRVYLNQNGFTVRQWYEIVALIEAYVSRKISEAEFIRISNEVINEGYIVSEREKIFDPWIPRGEIMKVGEKDVLETTRIGDHRYDGYQYYLTSVDDYIFVFSFGYGGVVIPREMWTRSDRHIREMIKTLKMI